MNTVYLVDDHALLRDGLRNVLRGAGHTVVGETADPAQALAQIEALKPELLLLDLNLGAASGLDVLRELQVRALPVRTLVLTMSAQPRHVAEAMRLGAAGYVLKGAPAAELLTAIAQVAQGQRHLGTGVAELAMQGLSAPSGEAALATLSARERQILDFVVHGRSSTDIANELALSPKTVESYRSRLMAKLGVADVPALVRFAIRQGLLESDDHGGH